MNKKLKYLLLFIIVLIGIDVFSQQITPVINKRRFGDHIIYEMSVMYLDGNKNGKLGLEIDYDKYELSHSKITFVFISNKEFDSLLFNIDNVEHYKELYFKNIDSYFYEITRREFRSMVNAQKINIDSHYYFSDFNFIWLKILDETVNNKNFKDK